MELRVLKYFLMTAREENITKAAGLLHITQPTLSRQLMQLEEELGVKLFTRSNHNIRLTEEGMLLRRRAQEIISLEEKTKVELSGSNGELAGEIAIGCGETRNMDFLSARIADFREKYPRVRFSIYTANADDIKERIEKGLLDLGLMMEPVDIRKYEFVRMPVREQWAVMVKEDSPLAEKKFITPKDLVGFPLIFVHRQSIKDTFAGWFGKYYDNLEIAATYNLVRNAVNMVQNGVGSAFCYVLDDVFPGIRIIPLAPKLDVGAVLAWKKEQPASAASVKFIDEVKKCISGISDNAI